MSRVIINVQCTGGKKTVMPTDISIKKKLKAFAENIEEKVEAKYDGKKFSARKAKYTNKFIQQLMEAKYKDHRNSKSEESIKITPQECDIGIFLVINRLSGTHTLRTRMFRKSIKDLAVNFSKFSNYRNYNEVEGTAKVVINDAVIIRALNKLDALKLIKYEMDFKRVGGKPTKEKGITIKFLSFD